MTRIAALDPASYRRHLIHGENRAWAETNCYSDVVIELLHGLGHEPIAALPFTLTQDFELDQWTFFKFPDSDLLDLYGFDIQELAVWRPLAEHVATQIAAGRPVLVELDSFFLPDTAGTAYKLAHVKSTVAVNEIDVAERRLGYFHNQAYHSLEGDDFADLFQLDGLVHERMLPPYIEFVKMRPGYPLNQKALLDGSLELLKKHVTRIPANNPFVAFKSHFERDLAWLGDAGIENFHAYSFATLRQYGACFELAETYVRWLGECGIGGLEQTVESLKNISETAKALQFQLARSIARKRPMDLSPLDATAGWWDSATMDLRSRYG
ncbi:MAG: DUF1839 family protein [Betaproteobacteria bacterium]